MTREREHMEGAQREDARRDAHKDVRRDSHEDAHKDANKEGAPTKGKPTRRKAPTRRTDAPRKGATSEEAPEREGAGSPAAAPRKAPTRRIDASRRGFGKDADAREEQAPSASDEVLEVAEENIVVMRPSAMAPMPSMGAGPSEESFDAEPADENSPKGEGIGAKLRRRWPVVLALVLVALLALGSLLFCWQRWWRFDDAADLVGAWRVEATGDIIVFDGQRLKLTSGIAYDYRLDPEEKTIRYSFGKLDGGGHYYFDASRQRLVIFDGDETLGVLAELGFLPADRLARDTAEDDMTVLAKVSSNADTVPTGREGEANAETGEREYLVSPDPEPEPSSSSSSKRSSKSRLSQQDDSLDDEDRDSDADDDDDSWDDEGDYYDADDEADEGADEDDFDDEDALYYSAEDDEPNITYDYRYGDDS